MGSDPETGVFDALTVDHVRFYVTDIEAKVEALKSGYGMSVVATTAAIDEEESQALATADILLVLTEPRTDDHPGAAYIERHGDGVADIALGVPDARAAFSAAVSRGARPVATPAEHAGFVIASVVGFGDVVHSFIERPAAGGRILPGLSAPVGEAGAGGVGFGRIDHFAVCLEGGQLDPTVQFYEDVLDFRTIFEERIVVGSQAMLSKVVQSRSQSVTLTLIEPDPSADAGQIDEFLKNHDGAGVQHIALTTDDIVRTVGELVGRDVTFLTAPGAYYDVLTERIQPARHPIADLRRLNLLMDEDHDGQLYQVFARSTHPRTTYFFEVIERAGARTFGSGNIKALYEAVELQRQAAFRAEHGDPLPE